MGPIAGCRVGYIDGQYVLNPTLDRLPSSQLDLLVAGTGEGVLMVESEAKELSEEVMLGAVTFGHKNFQPVIQAIIELAETCAKDPWNLAEPPANKATIEGRLRDAVGPQLEAAYRERNKQERSNRLDAAKLTAAALFENEDERALALKLFKDLEKEIVRGAILRGEQRIDGRDSKTVRPIDCQVGLLPRAHGSALFTRGETQALAVATLGTGQDEQIIDALEGEYRENFMLHYNFPPYSTGEAKRMGSPSRRDIGHGKLAWRAVRPLLPSKESFPYTIRIVSEITESNGSSSMASVCGASLALMGAGVPLARPGDRLGRQGGPRDRRGHRRQDRHRRRWRGQDCRGPRRRLEGGDRLDPRHRRRARARRDLRRQGRQGGGFRRLRELPRLAR